MSERLDEISGTDRKEPRVKELKHEWRLTWHGVDRRELFVALRDSPLREDAAMNASLMNDEDVDSPVIASVALDSLESLHEALRLTASLKPCYGIAMSVYAKDSGVSFSASLTGFPQYEDGRYAPRSAQVSYDTAAVEKNAVDAIREVESACSRLRDCLSSVGMAEKGRGT